MSTHIRDMETEIHDGHERIVLKIDALKAENERLKAENNQLERDRKTRNQCWQVVTADNERLKKENEWLEAENDHLRAKAIESAVKGNLMSRTTDDAYDRAELPPVYDCQGNVVAPAVERTDFALTPDNPSFAKMSCDPTIVLLAPYEEFLIREMRRLSIHPQAVIEILRKKQP